MPEDTIDIEAEEVTEERALVVVASGEMAERSIDELTRRVEKIRQVMGDLMEEDVHYGKIPGTNKPTLLKPGAELLCVQFMFDPEYISERIFHGEHLTVTSTCTLYHILTGARVASGEGMCSTFEEKYRWRDSKPFCPTCGMETINRSSKAAEFYCWRKIGGCGATFPLTEERITSQDVGRVENNRLPDLWNTVLKMSNKRALIAATLNATGASDVFTQDMEDGGGHADVAPPARPAREPSAKASPESVTKLTEILQKLEGQKGWSNAEVCWSSARSFGYQVETIADIAEGDIVQVIAAALAAVGENP